MSIPSRRLTASDAYRVGREVTAFDEMHTHPIDATVYASVVAGGGSVTHVPAYSVYTCGVASGGGDRALLRTHARPRPSSRRGRSASIVGFASGTSSGQRKRWGLFSDTDGVFFELDGGSLYAVRRSGGIDERIPREQWSVVASRALSIDPERQRVWEVRDAWPAGEVQLLVDGAHLHSFGIGDGPGQSIRSARLPVSIEVVNASATITGGSFSAYSVSVLLEDVPDFDRTFAVHQSATGITSAAAVLALRPVLTVSAQPNDAEIEPAMLTVTTSGEARLDIVQGGTVTGTWTQQGGSFAESAVSPTVSGGLVVASFHVSTGLALAGDDSMFNALRVLASGAQDTFALVATSATGAPITVRAALTWKETR